MKSADGQWWTAEEVAALSFEKAQAALEQVVQELEGGQLALDDALAVFQVGQLLEAHCRARLEAVEASIEQLVAGAGEASAGEEQP